MVKQGFYASTTRFLSSSAGDSIREKTNQAGGNGCGVLISLQRCNYLVFHPNSRRTGGGLRQALRAGDNARDIADHFCFMLRDQHKTVFIC